MKKLQLAFAALLLSATIAMAQPATKRQDKLHHPHGKEMALQQLNLTDAQKAELKVINDNFRKEMQALNSNENQTVKQQRDQRAALAKAHNEKLESILTPAQKNQLADLKKNVEQRGGKMTADRLNNLKTELSLTDRQVSQLQASHQTLESKMQAIRNNTSLDRSAKMTQMKALKDELKTSIDNVLTPEQREKWKTMHQGKRKGDKKHFGKHRTAAPTV